MEQASTFLMNTVKLSSQDVIVIGVSGGPDSMALLYLMMQLRKKIAFQMICSHVNHNIRKESKEEEEFLSHYCKEHDIVFERMQILKYGNDNFHNEARHIRYRFFEDIIEKYHANYLMTAHHGDDLMETILMRLTRGSTLKGYSGFQMMVDRGKYRIIRPLIFYSKEQILQYDQEHHIPYVIDRSNFKSTYTRNRYRKELLPFLKHEEPRIHEKFLKYSILLQECDAYIEVQSKKYFHKIFVNNQISIPQYLSLDPLLQEKVIYMILQNIYQDDLMLVDDRHVHLIQQLLHSKKANTFLHLPNNIILTKNYDMISITKGIDTIDDYEIELIDFAYLPNGKHIERLDECHENGNHICRLQSSDVKFPLYVRTRRIGDKISIKGMDGHKKLKDVFIDCKIPLKQRDLWPVVVDATNQIVWVPGLKKTKFDRLKSQNYDIIFKYY